MGKDVLVLKKVSELKNWDKNPRGIKKDDFERLKSQIKKLGIYKPLLINKDNVVLGGNMRLKAYKDLGIEEVEVNIVDAQDEAKMLEYVLSDNDRAGYWEEQDLAELLTNYAVDIKLDDYKIDLGKPSTLQDLLNQFGPEIVEDEPPPLPEEAESKLGEVYQLGRHRLMCGDATRIEDVEKLMDGKKADMVFTDPPYGIDFLPEEELGKLGKLKNDSKDYDEFTKFLDGWLPLLFTFLKDGGVYYICMGWEYTAYLIQKIKREMDNRVKQVIIWDRMAPTLHGFPQDFNPVYENILYGWKKGANRLMNGGNAGAEQKNNIWRFERMKAKDEVHSTEKPIALIVNALKCSSKTQETILDLFGGSGSTLIAAEQTNRTCYMMELDPKYCDVIRTRYENFIKNKEETKNGEPESN